MRSGPVTAVSKSARAARQGLRAARRTECNAATKRQPTGASSPDVLSRLPPEAMQLYHQAQNNIVALNDSRLKALNALSAARARIDELESEVEELRQEVKQTSYRLADALDVDGAATTQAETEVEGDAGSDGMGSQPAQQAGTATITLAYFTGWEPAYLHYCTDEQEWTKAPGTQMERGEGEFEGAYVLQMTGSMAQFVPNDGGNQWDNCPRNGGNYTIESGPGTYVLRDGQIKRT